MSDEYFKLPWQLNFSGWVRGLGTSDEVRERYDRLLNGLGAAGRQVRAAKRLHKKYQDLFGVRGPWGHFHGPQFTVRTWDDDGK